MTEPSRVVCPSCSEGGIECAGPKKVPKITLHSLVRPEHHDALPADPTYFCSDKDCETVYFDAGGRQITKDQLLVQVWQKEDTGDIPICYCFDFSARDIMEDAHREARRLVGAGALDAELLQFVQQRWQQQFGLIEVG